jgi:hypothetical protein
MTHHAFTIRDVSGRLHTVNLSDDRRGVAMDGLPRNMRRAGARDQGEEDNDPPPLKWSTLSYGFAHKEDCDAKEELQAGRDRRQAAAG